MRTVREHDWLVSERLVCVRRRSVVAVERPTARLARLCPAMACSRRRRSWWRRRFNACCVDRSDREVCELHPSLHPYHRSSTNALASSHSSFTPRKKNTHPPDGGWTLLESRNLLLSFVRHLHPYHPSVSSSTVCWHGQTRPQPRTTSSLNSRYIAILPPPTGLPSSSSPFCRWGATLENSWLAAIPRAFGMHGTTVSMRI